MPYMPVQQRAQGLGVRVVLDPHDGGPCDCDWVNGRYGAAELALRVLPRPDQSRYGPPAADPYGPDGPKWPTNRNGLPVKADEDGRPIK